MAKPVGPEVPKLNPKLLRLESVIRADLSQQLIDINNRWEAWKRKTDASDI
jgi:hypothetical protein